MPSEEYQQLDLETRKRAHRETAIRLMREAVEAEAAIRSLRVVASQKSPQFTEEQNAQRSLMLQLSCSIIENQIDSLMDNALSAWKFYKEN